MVKVYIFKLFLVASKNRSSFIFLILVSTALTSAPLFLKKKKNSSARDTFQNLLSVFIFVKNFSFFFFYTFFDKKNLQGPIRLVQFEKFFFSILEYTKEENMKNKKNIYKEENT